ncbi:MAG: DMT family protein [Alphaproteobacteria bacterium]|nr:DMT family protein [Alphaproteobacteria bacterium]
MPFASLSWPQVAPIVLLLVSNVFMTFAWYGHLKFTDRPLWLVVIASWGIAFIEYCFAVPANRFGHAAYSAAELKTMQEVITLLVFAAFSVLYLKESLTWNHAIGFAFIALGAFFVFKGPIATSG